MNYQDKDYLLSEEEFSGNDNKNDNKNDNNNGYEFSGVSKCCNNYKRPILIDSDMNSSEDEIYSTEEIQSDNDDYDIYYSDSDEEREYITKEYINNVFSNCKSFIEEKNEINKRSVSFINRGGTHFNDETIPMIAERLKDVDNVDNLSVIAYGTIGNNWRIKPIIDVLKTNTSIYDLNLSVCRFPDIESISDLLANNSIIKHIRLSANEIHNHHLDLLTITLKTNYTITELSLANNEITEDGAKYIGDLLKNNNTLLSLNLYNNPIRSYGLIHIFDGLKMNSRLTTLNLKKTLLTNSNFIGEILKQNSSLKELDISENHLSIGKIDYFVECLKLNQTLLKLDISSNRLANQKMSCIIEVLKTNTTLTNLDISSNRIRKDNYIDIEIFKYNTSLLELGNFNNYFGKGLNGQISEWIDENRNWNSSVGEANKL